MIRMTARYTEVLLNLLENPQTKELIDKALSTYPMYEPTNQMTYSLIPTREQLNNKILNHYKYREIGFETVGRFLDELKMTMEEIMPYYYQLFKSQDIMNGIEDPFGNVDITETFEQETEGSSKGSSSENANNKTETSSNSNTNTDSTTYGKNVNTDTPQSRTQIPAEDIDTITHASSVNWNKDQSNSKGDSSESGTATSESSNQGESTNETASKTSHVFKKQGNQGVNTYAHDMKELREIFLNIEQQIINDSRVKELFMLVY